MGEFDLIERYFKRPAHKAVLGVGDPLPKLRLATQHEQAASPALNARQWLFAADNDAANLAGALLDPGLSISGTANDPVLVCGENEALNLVTVGGGAHGFVDWFAEPV